MELKNQYPIFVSGCLLLSLVFTLNSFLVASSVLGGQSRERHGSGFRKTHLEVCLNVVHDARSNVVLPFTVDLRRFPPSSTPPSSLRSFDGAIVMGEQFINGTDVIDIGSAFPELNTLDMVPFVLPLQNSTTDALYVSVNWIGQRGLLEFRIDQDFCSRQPSFAILHWVLFRKGSYVSSSSTQSAILVQSAGVSVVDGRGEFKFGFLEEGEKVFSSTPLLLVQTTAGFPHILIVSQSTDELVVGEIKYSNARFADSIVEVRLIAMTAGQIQITENLTLSVSQLRTDKTGSYSASSSVEGLGCWQPNALAAATLSASDSTTSILSTVSSLNPFMIPTGQFQSIKCSSSGVERSPAVNITVNVLEFISDVYCNVSRDPVSNQIMSQGIQKKRNSILMAGVPPQDNRSINRTTNSRSGGCIERFSSIRELSQVRKSSSHDFEIAGTSCARKKRLSSAGQAKSCPGNEEKRFCV